MGRPSIGGRPGGPGGMGGGGGGGPRPSPGGGGGAYNANNPPGGAFRAPNGGSAPGEGGGGGGGRRGLGAIASGVRTPNDRYGDGRPPGGRRPEEGGGRYDVGPGPGARGGGYGARGGGGGAFEEGRRGGRGGAPPPSVPTPEAGGRVNNLRYEERDYGEYVSNLRRGVRPGSGPGPGPPGDVVALRNLEDEVERLRTENDLLKRSCQDLLNNFNELSNRLFDVDESLKKVAKVFPSEDEMESLEWLTRR
ncbi:hypothetical protein ACHAW5_001861 [Stephanodiscus triporus]|uniref:Uncharacterized protein n=1 Tax=Stephanodiscus triporus TaxID=2934178 RepID=A0ABD3PE16_9STRA